MTYDLETVFKVYTGSDGEATKQLYQALEQLGPIGNIALNLFRACKASERAKAYRGGGYRGKSYEKKQWSMDNLATALREYGAALGIKWGWAKDDAQEFHNWVLYVELPTGQVSFHTDHRGAGPDYLEGWDGQKGQGAGRIVMWIARVFAAHEMQACVDRSAAE